MNPNAWRDLGAAELQREYSPSSCIGGNYQPCLQAYADQSRKAHGDAVAAGALWHSLAYGDSPAQRVDLCVPAVPALSEKPGLLVFFHGGYWQALSAQDSLFAAAGCIRHGVAFAAVDYTLAPGATLAQIVAECRTAMAHLARQADALGFDANCMVVAGSSAGAHLAVMVALPRAQAEGGYAVRASVLVSGIYDLQPLVATDINVALGLDVATALAQSPALQPLTGCPSTLICWGDNETQEFKRQSRAFATQLAEVSTPCEYFEAAGRNHFDVILDLANDETRLGQATLSLFSSLHSSTVQKQ